jgi:hypothetical protein
LTFDLAAYLDRFLPPAGPVRDLALASAEVRRAITEAEPLLFALVYFSHHLRSDATGGVLTLSEAHVDWAERAKRLMRKGDGSRHADVAPREMGKSTWHFLLIPAWAAAHGHRKFVAAFADSGGQAETHLATFKHELETNALLRHDYPDLVEPLKRERGVVAADRVSLYRAKSGFVFAARGMDAKSLGLKVGSQRPDYIVLDDIEPDEASYSGKLKEKRLATLQDAILPLNNKADVQLVGTVTMPDSIVHELVKHARGQGTAAWIRDDGWTAHYTPPILTSDDGSERSVWPARWSLAYLLSIRHTRSYAKNYANDPLGADGHYWTLEHFKRAPLHGVTRKLVSIDPAVTTKDSSDFTGLAVIGWQPPSKGSAARGKCSVERARRVKLPGSEIRRLILQWLIDDPTIGLVLIETNQGGEVWLEILWGMPVPVKIKHQSIPKPVRAAQVLNHYERDRVYHAEGLHDLESEQVAFPNGANDDLVDAVGTGVAYFLNRKAKAGNRVRTVSAAA